MILVFIVVLRRIICSRKSGRNYFLFCPAMMSLIARLQVRVLTFVERHHGRSDQAVHQRMPCQFILLLLIATHSCNHEDDVFFQGHDHTNSHGYLAAPMFLHTTIRSWHVHIINHVNVQMVNITLRVLSRPDLASLPVIYQVSKCMLTDACFYILCVAHLHFQFDLFVQRFPFSCNVWC
jgi:hypothetical protein